MNLYKYLFCTIIISLGLSEDIVGVWYSNIIEFHIDSKDPLVEVLYPNGGEAFYSGENIEITWVANDSNFSESPIFVDLSIDYFTSTIALENNLNNSGNSDIELPSLDNGNSVLLRVSALDQFGNIGHDQSDAPFSIGLSNQMIVDTTIVIYSTLSNFIIDSRNPTIDLIYPTGGEHLTDYQTTSITWEANEVNLSCEVLVSNQIGGWYNQALSVITENLSINEIVDLSIGGLIAESRWGWLKVVCSDEVGNSDYSTLQDYIILGNPEGELSTDWLTTTDTDSVVVLDWSWKIGHLVVINSEALSFIESGDVISIIDQNAIINEYCSNEATGEMVLSSITSSGSEESFLFKLYCGADNCDLGGDRVPGYQTDNQILFQYLDISANQTTYLTPNTEDMAGLDTFDNGITIVNSFNEYPLGERADIGRSLDKGLFLKREQYLKTSGSESKNLNVALGIQNEGRDFDDYNIYRSTNLANLRDCSNDDGCTMIDNECVCLIAANVPQTYYFDNYVQTNNGQWCYDVWLLDNSQQEILKTVDSCMNSSIDLIWGDVNTDGLINILDVVSLLNYILIEDGGSGDISDLGIVQADFNQDGVLDILDIVGLVYFILNPLF